MKAILISQCLQNDFVKLIGKYDPLPNRLHVGYQESQRLLGQKLEQSPVDLVMKWAYDQDESELDIIHIRDWHSETDKGQAAHLDQFGPHCIKNTQGADFVFKASMRLDRPAHIINASGLNDFVDTDLAKILDQYPRDQVTRVGIMGVWTEAKVFFLAYELSTRYPHFDISLCSSLCASSSRHMHFVSLEQIRSILGVRIFASINDFTLHLAGSVPQSVSFTQETGRNENIEIEGPIKDTDRLIVQYLLRNCHDAHIKPLDGGFSGNAVLKVRAHDALGHEQVPSVIKIGPRSPMAQERMNFERIEEVLGNSAPSIVDFVEIEDRGAIQYRYASMSSGRVASFQDFYEEGRPQKKIEAILDRVFGAQLGKLYEARSLEKINYFDLYDFRPSYATGIEKNLGLILGEQFSLDHSISPHSSVKDLLSFYTDLVPTFQNSLNHSGYISFVHGDLNGKNILIDSQGNVWIIDFFNCDRSHVLRDLIKLENDLLFIFLKIKNESMFNETLMVLEYLASIEDIAKPLDIGFGARLKEAEVRRAFETIVKLRSFYHRLVDLDKSSFGTLVGQLRYAAHTLSFDECDIYQKRLALYRAGLCVEQLKIFLSVPDELRIDFVDEPRIDHQLGLTILPGRRDRGRDLARDIESIKKQNIDCVVCLISEDEFEEYGVSTIKTVYAESKLEAYYLPILDQSVPSLEQWNKLYSFMRDKMDSGQRILVHCLGGLGRSGLVAASFLVQYLHFKAEDAIALVRRTRSSRAIETAVQEQFIADLQ